MEKIERQQPDATGHSARRPNPAALRRAACWIIVLLGVVAMLRPHHALAAQPVLDITDGGAVMAPGDAATYTVTVANQSPTDRLHSIQLDVTLTGGAVLTDCAVNAPLTGVCLIAPDALTGRITITDDLGLASTSGLISGTVTVRAQTQVSQASDIGATVSLTAQDGANAPVTTGPLQDTTPVLQPAVAAALSADALSVLPGDPLRYTIRLNNTSGVTATALSAVLSLPPGVTVLAVSDAGTQPDGATVRWDNITLPGPATITRTVEAVVENPLAPVATQLTAMLTATHASGDIPAASTTTPVESGAINGVVWQDRDGNGVRNNGEAGIGDVAVVIGAGAVDASVTTTADGSYALAGLRPDNYTVRLELASLPAGLRPTHEPDRVLDNRIAVTVTTGTPAGASFGYAHPTAAADGVLFLDRDGNGAQDPGDDGIPDVRVLAQSSGADRLFNTDDDVTVSALTDSLGTYGFAALLPGRYRIRVEPSSVPQGYLLNSEPDDTLNGLVAVTLTESGAARGLDFGYRALDLRIRQSDNDLTVTTGAVLPYHLHVENVGPVDATDVAVVETVPANSRVDPTVSSSGWLCDGGGEAGDVCRYLIGALGSGESRDLIFGVTVADAMPAHTNVLTNTVQVLDRSAGAPDPTPQNNQSILTTPVDAAPDLTIRQTDGGARTEPGVMLVYTMTYRNQGNQHATGVTVVQQVPAHTTFDPAASTPGWTCAPDNAPGSRCSFLVGTLDAGATGELAFAMLLDPAMPVNVAAIDAQVSIFDDQGVNASDNELTPVDSTPDLQLVKDHTADTVEPGTVIVFTLDYTNAGNQDAIGVLVVETVPTHTSFEPDQSTPGWNCQLNGQAGDNCIYSIGALHAGASGRLEFAVRVDANLPPTVSEIGSTAVIAGSGVELDIVNNEAPGSVPVDRPTAVDLVRFETVARDSVIDLTWETSAERESWGFLIYRSTDRNWENAIQLTPLLIEARGNESSGAVYGFTDESAVSGVPYLYWLQELELTGRTTVYGPITGLVGAGEPGQPAPGPGPGVGEPGGPGGTRVFLPYVLNR